MEALRLLLKALVTEIRNNWLMFKEGWDNMPELGALAAIQSVTSNPNVNLTNETFPFTEMKLHGGRF